MVGTFRVRVILSGDYTNATSTVATDLETQTFTLTRRKRTYTTTIRGTLNGGNIFIGTVGQFPNSSGFGFFIQIDTSIFDNRKPELNRGTITLDNNKVTHFVNVQRIA